MLFYAIIVGIFAALSTDDEITLGMSNDETNHPIGRGQMFRYAGTRRTNPHVLALTVGPEWINDEELFVPNRLERHRRQYHLRRMWATNLLHDLKRLGFKWPEIERLTQRKRQSWTNVTAGDYPTTEWFEKRYGPRAHTGERRPGRPTIENKAEKRTVFGIPDRFIEAVVAGLNEELFHLNTEEFVESVKQGLVVLATDDPKKLMAFAESSGMDRRWSLGTLEDVTRRWGSVGQEADTRDDRPSILCTHWTGGDDDATSWTRMRPDFSLLEFRHVVSDKEREEFTIKHMRMLESVRWGEDARTHGWAHKRQSQIEFEAVQRKMVEAQAAKVDPEHFGGVNVIPDRVEVPTEPVIKKDDGTNPLAALGFHTIPINLDVHPNMLGSDGQVTFTVTLQYRGDVKVGHSIMAHPPVDA